MKPRVGIPRAMGYYYLYPFYKTLLEDLGAEVIISPPTTKATLDRMEACPTDEPCIAVKLYFAHAEALSSLHVDFIFNPVLASLEKDNFCCPKFLGISDMVRNGLGLEPSSLLSPRFDRRPDSNWEQPFIEAAAKLGVTNKDRVHEALRHAERVQLAAERMMTHHQKTIPEAYHLLDAGENIEGLLHRDPGRYDLEMCVRRDIPRIGVIGHPYILYDMLSHDIVQRVEEFGRVVTAEMVCTEDARAAMSGIFEGYRMWSFEQRILGSALHLLKNDLIDKLILIGSFECGPESIIESFIEDEAERQGVPFLLLTIDEQTGEAGLETRVEAFMDTALYKPAFGLSEDKLIGAKGGALEMPISPVARDEMIVGFPSMGYLDIAIRATLEECGTRCVKNPRTSKKAIELGAELTPEFVCFPLTATLGQMRVLLDSGANTIFMVNGKGRCRLGWYAQVQEQLLRRAGYDFDMVTLDSPAPLKTNWAAFRDTLKRLTGGASWKRILQSFYFGYSKMAAIDRAESICRRLRAIERERGAVDHIFDRFVPRVDKASSMRALRREVLDLDEAVREIEVEETNPLRVRIVGEIWVVLEHYANQEIEKMLASQSDVRVEVDMDMSATGWFRRNVLSDPFLISREHKVCRAAHTYLAEDVGGHGLESVGSTVLAPREGCDGVVHIFPFTCMPEIVAQNILVNACEQLDIPTLTYIVSEQTGEAGLQTRVEAFLDVLEERRQHRKSPVMKRKVGWHTTSA